MMTRSTVVLQYASMNTLFDVLDVAARRHNIEYTAPSFLEVGDMVVHQTPCDPTNASDCGCPIDCGCPDACDTDAWRAEPIRIGRITQEQDADGLRYRIESCGTTYVAHHGGLVFRWRSNS